MKSGKKRLFLDKLYADPKQIHPQSLFSERIIIANRFLMNPIS